MMLCGDLKGVRSVTLPWWVRGWLMFSTFICALDVTYTLFRPHTLPGGAIAYTFPFVICKYHMTVPASYLIRNKTASRKISISAYVTSIDDRWKRSIVLIKKHQKEFIK